MQKKYNYFKRKNHIHDEDRELIKDTKIYKKYSKKALYAGAIGFGLLAIDYLFFGEPNLQTLSEPLSQMKDIKLVETAMFSLSSLGLVGGGIMYGLSSFMREDHKNRLKRERKTNLEKEIIESSN